jgi:hypothetical protein
MFRPTFPQVAVAVSVLIVLLLSPIDDNQFVVGFCPISSRSRSSKHVIPYDNNGITGVVVPVPTSTSSSLLHGQISKERRKQLGINDADGEYDLDKMLDANTDPLISKIIAGSLIVTIIALLVVGVIVPVTTDYGDGVCNPRYVQRLIELGASTQILIEPSAQGTKSFIPS